MSHEGNELDLSLDVTLTRYPLPDASARTCRPWWPPCWCSWPAPSSSGWRAGTATAAAFLAGCALLPVGLTSAPCGLGAIDAAGGRGLWPHLVGEIAFAVGLGLLLLAALTFRAPPGWLRARPWVALVVLVVPAVGYAVWIGGPARGLTPEAARLQALITVAVPAALAVVPAVLLALTWRYLRAPTRDDVLAVRLALLTIGAGLVAVLLLGVVPEQVTGQPLLPWGVLVLLLSPAVLALLVVAIVGYRLDEIEPTVRRALVQAVVAAVFATAFVAIAAGVDQASETSFDSMLAGGVVALLVLPLAVVLQRLVRRAVYGDRDLPQRVVSELRGLDVTTTPGETLTEALALLARRLRLSHASVEVPAAEGAEAWRRRSASPAADPSPSTCRPADTTSGCCAWRSRRTATRSDPATGGCSRTSAARWAVWCRRCWPTASCNAPGSGSSPPARRSGVGCGATFTTGWVPRWPPWPCAWSRSRT